MFQTKIKLRQHGFTLVELIIVLAVAAILTGVAAPSFVSLIANNRVVTASNELVTALNLGKSEAIRTGENTVLCKSENGTDCSTETDWKNGWILFSDTINNQTIDAGEQIIRVHTKLDDSLNFTFRTGNYIRFAANGQLNESGRFCFVNSYQPENSRAVVIFQTGRIRTEVRNAADDCDSA